MNLSTLKCKLPKAGILFVLLTAISPVPRAMPKISLTPEKSVLDEHITKHAVIPSQDIRMCAVIGARGKGVECMQTLGMVKVGDRKREGPVHTPGRTRCL